MSTVVVNLVPYLSPHKRLHLFSCVARTPFSKYTEQTLQLVRRPAGRGGEGGGGGMIVVATFVAHAELSHSCNTSKKGSSIFK